jgi:peptide/nickel transport system substrate-binding protein
MLQESNRNGIRNRLTWSRRRALGVAAAGTGAAFLAACGGGKNSSSSKSAATTAATSASANTSGAPAASAAAATRPAQAPAAAVTTPPPAAAAEQPVRGGTLRLGTWLNVLGIDPHIEVSVGLVQIARIYTYLGGFNTIDQTWNPVFADSVEQKSPQEFVFKLKKGVKFHNVTPVNGRECTAQDVVYSFQRARDLPQSQGAVFFKQYVDQMEAIDPYTFRLTTKTPYAETMYELGEWKKAIVAREAVEKFGDLSQNAIGAGPYIMEEYVKGDRLNLKRNPDYFDSKLPYPDKVTWVTILDQGTLLQAYKADKLDINGTLLTKLDFDDLKKNDKLVNVKYPGLHYGWFGVNVSVKPFSDKRVRQALWALVDRQQFIDKVGLGEGTPQAVLSNGLSFWVLSQDEIKPYVTPDIKKAKDLLAAAGYPNGFDMDLDTSGGVQLYIDHSDVLVPQLKQVGINAKPRLSELSSFLSNTLFKGNFNAVVLTGNPYETPNRPLDFYHKNGVSDLNWFHYDNPDINALIDAQKMELDNNKRQKLVKDAQKAIMEDAAPLISFFSPVVFDSYHKRVGGYDPTLRQYQIYRYTEYIKPNV